MPGQALRQSIGCNISIHRSDSGRLLCRHTPHSEWLISLPQLGHHLCMRLSWLYSSSLGPALSALLSAMRLRLDSGRGSRWCLRGLSHLPGTHVALTKLGGVCDCIVEATAWQALTLLALIMHAMRSSQSRRICCDENKLQRIEQCGAGGGEAACLGGGCDVLPAGADHCAAACKPQQCCTSEEFMACHSIECSDDLSKQKHQPTTAESAASLPLARRSLCSC